ncbi:hypothetical protein GNY06_08880 [Elizabethkingia argentiflava]|uniref:Lipoprotein n=1 Tax=Elizabethkingia argenteiflava TaxID=2681556 RepID=A0A845PXA8_9FLAO|nr:hypothetical protein [Elizabethkingia argenteiflava]NAW51486.1 hypothetical protein [Elizabethkingia argenteiflava]
MKTMVIIPVVLLLALSSCSKGPSKTADSKEDTLQTAQPVKVDSLAQQVEPTDDRQVTDSLITRTVDLQKLPVQISDEFTNEDQVLVLQLKNKGKDKISGHITPDKKGQNIRFSGVSLNNEGIDGPFGSDIEYEMNEKGDYSLEIGKNTRAEGSQIGKFTVTLK